MSDPTEADWIAMGLARDEAAKGLAEGGVPVGSVLMRGSTLLGGGRNRRVQSGDPIAHGEMDCIRNAGRQRTYRDTVLYTTLSPCMMCAGAILQFAVPRVVIGENRTFGGNEGLLLSRGVEVVLLDDPACKALMDSFIEHYPDIWAEDIGDG